MHASTQTPSALGLNPFRQALQTVPSAEQLMQRLSRQPEGGSGGGGEADGGWVPGALHVHGAGRSRCHWHGHHPS